MNDCWQQRKIFIGKINEFLYLINGEAKHDVETFLSNNHNLDEYKSYILKYHEIALKVPLCIKSKEIIGVFEVHLNQIINILCKQANVFKNAIFTHMQSTYLNNRIQ